jgi:hypothetical protein
MEKTSAVVEALRELDPESVPDLWQDIRGRAAELADGISSGMGKTASVAEYGKNFALALGGAIAAGAGAALAADTYSAAKGALTKGRGFRRMLAHDPDLAGYDSKKLRAAFDAVHRYGGSEVTSDPMVASAATRSFLEVPSLAFKNMQELADARKTVAETTGKYFTHAGAAGQSLPQTRKDLQQQARDDAKNARDDARSAREIGKEEEELSAYKVLAGLPHDYKPSGIAPLAGDDMSSLSKVIGPSGRIYSGDKPRGPKGGKGPKP